MAKKNEKINLERKRKNAPPFNDEIIFFGTSRLPCHEVSECPPSLKGGRIDVFMYFAPDFFSTAIATSNPYLNRGLADIPIL